MIYIRTYVCTYVRMYMYNNYCARTRTCVYTIYVRTYVHTHVCVIIYIHIHARIYVCIKLMYVCVHA